MPRLLVIGKQIPRLTCIEWDECSNYNLLDYQGLLIDCRNPSRISQAPGLPNVLSQFMRHGHRVFVILPGASDISTFTLNILSPLKLNLQQTKGETLLVASHASAFFREYAKSLRGHGVIISVGQTTTHLPHGWQWVTTISDNVDRAVCGQYGSAYILHPPATRSEAIAINAILDFFKPDYVEAEPEQEPDWVKDIAVKLPGMVEIEAAASVKRTEIVRLQSQLEADENKKLEIAGWTELLWLDGIALQNRVSKALTSLGIPNKSRDSTGHTQDLEGTSGGRLYLFELTGSNGSITIDKGRQLLQWLAESADPTNSKGVLVGNAFRKLAPSERPPSANHRIFVKELEDMASKFHFALLDVREIFDLIVRKLNGEHIDAARICEGLNADGVVRIPRPETLIKSAKS